MNEQTMIDLVNRVADNDKVAPFQNGFVVLTNEEMVKLAELIVRECASVSTAWDCELALGIADEIKQHFGVE